MANKKSNAKWISLIAALILIFCSFGKETKKEVSSFVPYTIAEGYAMSPAAKYVVLTSTTETSASQPNLMAILGLILLAIIIFSQDKK